MQEGDQFTYRIVLIGNLAVALVCAFVLRSILAGHKPADRLDFFVIGLLAMVVGGWTVIALLNTGFYRQWMPWLEQPKSSPLNSVLATLISVLLLTETLAMIMVVALDAGWASLAPTLFDGVDVDGTGLTLLGSHQAMWRLEEIYLWHLADAVPALKVPETLDWKLSRDLDANGGVIVLIYKSLVVLPIISLVRGLLSRSLPTNDQPPPGGSSRRN